MEKLLEAVVFAIGRAEGYESKPVIRKHFEKHGRAALQAVHDNLKSRLQHDEEGVLEMLQGQKGALE